MNNLRSPSSGNSDYPDPDPHQFHQVVRTNHTKVNRPPSQNWKLETEGLHRVMWQESQYTNGNQASAWPKMGDEDCDL